MWGPAPGDVYVDDGALVFPGIDLGGVLVTIQPPRGFGADPIAVYHSPDLPPPTTTSRSTVAGLDDGGGAPTPSCTSASTARSSGCRARRSRCPAQLLARRRPGRRAALLPVRGERPGEGTQAKRRAHAVVIDHLLPPMTRADTYDDLAGSSSCSTRTLQCQRSTRRSCRPSRDQVWDLLVDAAIHRDLDLGDAPPDDDDFDDVILHVDGYLCASRTPRSAAASTCSAGTRRRRRSSTSCWPSPGCPRARSRRCAPPWPPSSASTLDARAARLDASRTTVAPAFAALARTRLAPGSERRSDAALGGRLARARPAANARRDRPTCSPASPAATCPPAPSGAPTRGGAHVLPTGRNFYSVDPKALPARWRGRSGVALADRLVERHLAETGAHPTTVGLVLWGTAAMRTKGDDVAEALALLGVRPVWEPESRRVTGLEAIPLAELGRPRIDVTLRISGFFRDAFPHVVALLDDAVRLVAAARRTRGGQPVRAPGTDDARLFGPPPGGYGSGILPVIEQGTGAPTTTWPRCTSRGRASPTAALATAWPTTTPCAGASPPSRWP